MTNLNKIALETIKTEGVKIRIKGKEVDLETIDEQELDALMEGATDEECLAIIEDMYAQLGEDKMEALMESLETEVEDDEDGDEDLGEPTLNPILLPSPSDMEYSDNDFESGIDDASYYSGQFTAFLNCGMTKQQAFELVGMQLRHELDMEMFEQQARLQRALKDKDVKLQSQIGALNQLLTQE